MANQRVDVGILLVALIAVAPVASGQEQASLARNGTVFLASHLPLVSAANGTLAPLPAVPDSAPVIAPAVDGLPLQAVPNSPAGREAPVTVELAMQPEDGRVSSAIKRFVEKHGWQLAWEIERDFPIEYPATFTGDFLGIIEQVVLSLQNSDAPIRVKVYEANRVLRVVHATQ
ncbi:type IV pilus assembly protein [Pandoraea iniqua]|uniref:Type IV pilus assembly protein n=1 Tax=Pandoraea iniqua TaxID=2508288 RepID=A0A5E4RZ41_9BURK|nr:toxin co-regulated pilus biosynthesis Q family protein [Pandoraea iniqua]VVD68726.1 type IV pilus assembly protein [Pandoraea iniqua]